MMIMLRIAVNDSTTRLGLPPWIAYLMPSRNRAAAYRPERTTGLSRGRDPISRVLERGLTK
jgi:hypothetical protein